MNYLVSAFECYLVGDEKYHILRNVKYRIDRTQNSTYIVYGINGELPYIFDFESHDNVLKIECNGDTYFYLSANCVDPFTTLIKFESRMVNVTLGAKLSIVIDGEKVCDERVNYIEYSHFEIRRNYLVIYFKGKRDYVVIIRDKILLTASYYDEINIVDGELIFMMKCHDSLNHGKVYYLKKNYEYDSYLVYLDNNEMHLKDDFLPFVFLDAIMVGNLKYANKLLDASIQQEDEKNVQEFFIDFNNYIVMDNAFALINKNTLAGIYTFEIDNNKISNIIQLN